MVVVDNRLSDGLRTTRETLREMAARFKARRLAFDLTQEGLAVRAGVSWGSLKRFESSGLIALDSLLKLALVLDCLGDFDRVCDDAADSLARRSLDELMAVPKGRRRGRIT